jgi:serine/threonine-protein kinase
MLTGHLPFEGETATDTLARIIEREPNWELLPQNIPGNIHRLLRRCLEKDPNRRLADISDAAVEISETLSKPQTVPTAKLRRIMMILSAVIIIVVLAIALCFLLEKQSQPSSSEIRLVVLPFENLGPSEDEYFADGITDAITARLAVIHGLGVISRQSAMQYKEREKNTRQIAEELDVDYILEGTIQRERPSDPTGKVRVIPQLIKVSNDTHVWSDIYDNDMHEVFQIQSDLAERITQALDIALLEPERQALGTRPTANIEAYEYYLRGNDYFHRSIHENDMMIAIRMYEKAVELDPAFALAYARLSSAHVDMYWFHYDRSEQRLTKAKQAVDRALELDPDLPEGYIAMGWYYYHGHQEYDSALEQFAIARKGQPNNSELLFAIGLVQRRQGRFEKALTNIERACKLDPLSSKHAYEAGYTLMMLRWYREAERYFDRAISLAPDERVVYSHKARLYLFWKGSVEKARAVLAEALQNVKATEDAYYAHLLVTLDVYDGNYQEALDRLSLQSEDHDNPVSFVPNALRRAEICGYMGNEDLKHQYYESAAAILEKKVGEDPNDHRFHIALGKAYAGLGREADAIRQGKRGVELLPVSKDAMRGLARIRDLACIYAMVGEFDTAIDQLEFVLSRPGGMSKPFLRLDPAWAPLRDHPRFQKLVDTSK